ncbi:hypothetical protein WJX73_001543 [Symbiochloris irregularis]|uniref:Phosphodiesterase n=1 Tax=Symbiochloris irregularis TaxID=706552 RepID=A0AAW1NUT5_9CHLO
MKPRYGALSSDGTADSPLAYPEIWTLDQLKAHIRYHQPCFILRPGEAKGQHRCVLWGNKAAHAKFGKPLTQHEVEAGFAALPPHLSAVFNACEEQLHESLQVQGRRVRCCNDMGPSMALYWTNFLHGFYVNFREQAIRVEVAGRPLGCYLCAVESEVNANQARNVALAGACPVHSYMFNMQGWLVHATQPVISQLASAGIDPKKYTLSELLKHNGMPQVELAQKALSAICWQQQRHYTASLSSPQKDGTMRHTQYEMWPAQDPVGQMAPVLVVSSFDVTPQKQAEMELHAMKAALQRHNMDLQQKVQAAFEKQAKLEAALVSQQKITLDVRVAPRTQLDTASPIDKAVSMFDGLLAGQVPDTASILAVRNLLQSGSNPRRVAQNLESQLKANTHLDEEAGRSLLALLQEPSPKPLKTSPGASLRVDRLAWHQQLRARSLTGQQRKPSRIGSESMNEPPGRMSSIRSSVDNESIAEESSGGDGLWPENSVGMEVLHRPSLRGSLARVTEDPLPTPQPTIMTEVENLLQQASGDWGFDMTILDKATDGCCLSCFGYWLLQESGLLARFCIPEARMVAALRAIEVGYQNNIHYHNRAHAASVLHVMHMLVHTPGGLRTHAMLSDEIELAVYLAAACHDYEHLGVNNDFLIKSRHEWALLHNDRSPLENHHASAGFKMLHKHLFDGGKEWDVEGVDQFLRPLFIDFILGTDMKQHFAILSRLQGATQSGAYSNVASGQLSQELGLRRTSSALPPMATEHQLLIMQVAIKSADLGHVTLPWHLHKTWGQPTQQQPGGVL